MILFNFRFRTKKPSLTYVKTNSPEISQVSTFPEFHPWVSLTKRLIINSFDYRRFKIIVKRLIYRNTCSKYSWQKHKHRTDITLNNLLDRLHRLRQSTGCFKQKKKQYHYLKMTFTPTSRLLIQKVWRNFNIYRCTQ